MMPTSSTASRTATPARRRGLVPVLIIAGLHLVGWGSLLLLVAPQNLAVGTEGGRPVLLGVGLGLTAYTLGMRHAFDADHIAAIDNTTRSLLGNNKPAATVGLWFSLGHSTVVFVLCVLVALGMRSVVSAVGDDGSTLQRAAGIIGPTVSGVFLIFIAVLNAHAVTGLVHRARAGAGASAAPYRGAAGGVVGRVVLGANRHIVRPEQMFAVGLLFGLGFDTATEVSLLLIAGNAATHSIGWLAILTLPVLFAAGMSLLDTTQGAVMRRAYGWASSAPERALTYDIVVTSVSLVVALVIGAVELSAVLGDVTNRHGILALIGSIDLSTYGIGLTGFVALVWAGFVLRGRADRRRSGDA